MSRFSTAFPNIYINALPKAIYNKSIPVLVADDTSILFTHSCLTDLKNHQHSIFETINNWFSVVYSLLCLNFAKARYIYFVTKSNMPIDMQICFDNKNP
jgi:hypothetical protein